MKTPVIATLLMPSVEEINDAGINLEYLIDAYNSLNMGDSFFLYPDNER